MNESWKPTGAKYPLRRRILDIFDDTKGYRSWRKDAKTSLKKIKKNNLNLIPKEQNYVQATTINDYIKPTEHFFEIPILKPKVIKKNFDIIFPQFILSRREIKIKIPKIKLNITNLRKLAFFGVFCASVIVVFFAAFVSWRIIDITDGDYLGETYRYKIAEFEKNLVIPLASRVDRIEKNQNEIDALRDAVEYRRLTGYKPPQKKTIRVYNSYDGKIIKEIKEGF